MNHIIVDLEASCWKGWKNQELMETIEIGAVKLDVQLAIVSEFTIFIQPVRTESLSPFCIELTSITQVDVDQAEPFPAAFMEFVKWVGWQPFRWYSWGNYDRKQLFKDIAYHAVEYPPGLEKHTNVKALVAE